MLHASTINPFDSQEARPYRDDPEIVAMTALVQAFHTNDIVAFERTLRRLQQDEFVRQHAQNLLRTVRRLISAFRCRVWRSSCVIFLSRMWNNCWWD